MTKFVEREKWTVFAVNAVAAKPNVAVLTGTHIKALRSLLSSISSLLKTRDLPTNRVPGRIAVPVSTNGRNHF